METAGEPATPHDQAAPAGGRPLVSIVMPMLNEERYIAACLDSLLAQTFDMSRAEFFVIDGGSTDRSRDIVREYGRRHAGIALLDNPFRYQAQALNIAIPHCRGEYVLRIDCHSSYPPDYVAQVVRTFEETGADNVAGATISRPGAETTEAMAIYLVQGSRLGGGASYARQEGGVGRFLSGPGMTSGWSFRRSAILRTGPFDERLIRNQDNEYTCRLAQKGGRVFWGPKVRSIYYARSRVGKFLRLMFRNGFYHMLTWRVCPQSFAVMHSVPAVFVLALLTLSAAAVFWPPARWLLGGMMAVYGLAVTGAAIGAAMNAGARYLAWLPWLFFLTHLAYGSGTLLGAVRFGMIRLDNTDAQRCRDTATLEKSEMRGPKLETSPKDP